MADIEGPVEAGWVWLVAFVDVVATLSPFLFPLPFLRVGDWNWGGKIANIVAMLALCAVMVRHGVLTRDAIGLHTRRSTGSGRALIFVLAVYFLGLAALKGFTSGPRDWPSVETLAFEATLPGVAEELTYRGVLTALFDRLSSPWPRTRIRVFGAEMGYGSFVVSAAFGLLHGVTFDEQLALQCSLPTVAFTGTVGLVLAWVRARSGNLVLPVAAHNLTNLVLVAMPGLR